MVKIEKCPFCGGVAHMTVSYNAARDCYYTQVKCGDCFAQGPAARSVYKPEAEDETDGTVRVAAERWNRRAE